MKAQWPLWDVLPGSVNKTIVPAVGETLLPLEPRLVQRWLDGAVGTVHWWSAEADLLQASAQRLTAHLAERKAGALTKVVDEPDFLPWLKQLNAMLAAPAGAHAACQVWLFMQAERWPATHLELLGRLGQHCPELPVRLALFSHTPQAPVPQPGMQVQEIRIQKEQVMQADKPAAANGSGTASQGWLAWVMGGATLILSVLMLWQAVHTVATRPDVRGAAPETAQAGIASAESSTPPAASALASMPPPASAEVAQTVSEPVPLAQASQPPAAHVPVAVASAPSQPYQPASSAAEPISSGKKWLQALPAGSLLVVHVRTRTAQEAEGFRGSRPLLANARILQASPSVGSGHGYLLVTGPFRSAERAQNYIQRLDWKAGAASLSREELLPMTR